MLEEDKNILKAAGIGDDYCPEGYDESEIINGDYDEIDAL